MGKVALILLVGLMCVFLVSCSAVKKPSAGTQTKVHREQYEYSKVVFMGDECVAWFNPDSSVIGRMDMAEYLKENQIKPDRDEILKHFSSLGWKLDKEIQKDKYTTEFQLRRLVK